MVFVHFTHTVVPSISNFLPAPTGDQVLEVKSPFNPIGSVQSELDESTTSNLVSSFQTSNFTKRFLNVKNIIAQFRQL